MTHEEIYKQNLNQPYQDRRRKDRHDGIFTADNPYYTQLKLSKKKQDIDALYERSVEWEAQALRTAQDRDYSEQIRDEQREYDSPIQRVARDRAAGINSDLVGGSAGSGSSSGSSGAISNAIEQQDPVQGQTKFSNKYDNINSFSSALSSVSGFISSATGGFANIVSGISQLKILPSQLKLSETGAKVASESADNVISQRKIETAQMAQNLASSGFQNIKELSNFFNSDTSDEDIISTLGALGVPAEEHQNKLYGIRQYQSNPAWKAYEENQKSEANNAKSYNDVYTPSFLSRMYGVQSMIEENQRDFDMLKSNFDKAFSEYLYTQDNAELYAQEQVIGVKSNISDGVTNMDSNLTLQKNNDLVRRNLQQSINAIEEHITIQANEVKRVRREKDILLFKFKRDGYLSAHEKTLLDAYTQYEWTVLVGGQESFNVLNSGRRQLARQEYLFNTLSHIKNDGYKLDVFDPFNSFYRTYGDSFFIDHVGGDTGISGGDIGSVASEVFKSGMQMFLTKGKVTNVKIPKGNITKGKIPKGKTK